MDMTDNLRRQLQETLKAKNMTQADLARAIHKEPQAISRALNGHTSGGSVPPIWRAMLEALQLELTVQPSSGEPVAPSSET
jgi:transcriptional regulator with XRE-family HTH domain